MLKKRENFLVSNAMKRRTHYNYYLLQAKQY